MYSALRSLRPKFALKSSKGFTRRSDPDRYAISLRTGIAFCSASSRCGARRYDVGQDHGLAHLTKGGNASRLNEVINETNCPRYRYRAATGRMQQGTAQEGRNPARTGEFGPARSKWRYDQLDRSNPGQGSDQPSFQDRWPAAGKNRERRQSREAGPGRRKD